MTQQKTTFTLQAVYEELLFINGDYADDFLADSRQIDVYHALFVELEAMFSNGSWKQRFLTSRHPELYREYAEARLSSNLLDTQIVFEEALEFMASVN